MSEFTNASKERLESSLAAAEVWLTRSKNDVLKYEDRIKQITEALKNFGSDVASTTKAVQVEVEKVAADVVDKAEEVVEVVKEEVKKVAAKKPAAKKAESKDESSDESAK